MIFLEEDRAGCSNVTDTDKRAAGVECSFLSRMSTFSFSNPGSNLDMCMYVCMANVQE